MFFALCPGPFFFVEELLELSELLMGVASWCALFVLAMIVLVRRGDARRKRTAKRYSLGLSDG